MDERTSEQRGRDISSFECGEGVFHVISYQRSELPASANLSDAERVVAGLLIDGLRPQAIAAQRGTSLRTTRNQIASVYRKVGVCSLGELVAQCAESPEG